MDSLVSFTEDNVSLDKDELKRNLGIVHNALYGLSSCLPFWQGTVVGGVVPESTVSHEPVKLMTMSEELEAAAAEKLTVKGGNTRKAIIEVMDKVQVKL